MCRIRRAVIRSPRPGHLADRKRRDAAASLCMRALPRQSSRLLLQRALLTRNVSPLMPINCLINQRDKKTKRRRVKETKRQRDEGTKSQRDKETKRQRDKERKGQRDKETKSQRDEEIKRKRGKDKKQENPLKSMAAAPLL